MRGIYARTLAAAAVVASTAAAVGASAAAVAAGIPAVAAARPNVIWVVTDDQDARLGSYAVMPNLRRHLLDGGTQFANAFIASPKCCPSRTSALSGRFPHGLEDQALGWCGDFAADRENATFAVGLRAAGYRTFIGGKYYNAENNFCASRIHVPAGYDECFLMCEEGRYFNVTYNDNGVAVTTGAAPEDYTTAVLGNRSVAFVRAALAAGDRPFFAYIAPHAPHLPATPAPWYADAAVPAAAPRTPNFNTGTAGKHWQVARNAPMGAWYVNATDTHYANRLRALLSVDDLLGALFDELAAGGALDSTVVLFTSDHGYHSGQWALWAEKSQPYEETVHIPFLVRGPGVPRGVTSDALVSSIDISATISELAGVAAPGAPRLTDGRSLVPLLGGGGAAWPRDRVLIEFFGWPSDQLLGPCQQGAAFPVPRVACPEPEGTPVPLIDASSNVFSALRVLNATHDLLYAEYRPAPDAPLTPGATNWTEAYNITADPWQMVNLYPDGLPAATLAALSSELWAIATCERDSCP